MKTTASQMLSKTFLSASLNAALFGAAALSGCNQNPYPVEANGRITQGQMEQPPVPLAYSVEVKEVIECSEGVECSFIVGGHVPDGKMPVLNFKGLPKEATIDPATGKVTYTPSYDVVNQAADPKRMHESIPVEAVLTTKDDPITAYRKSFTILVKNISRPLTISTTAEVEVREGTLGEQAITVQSQDLPQGPFSAMLSNQPEGMVVAAGDDANHLKIQYAPSRKVVRSDDYSDGQNSKAFNPKLTVSLPNGQTQEFSLSWRVLNDRVAPTITAPAKIAQGPVINFTVRTEDMNGEGVPVLKEGYDSVPFGNLRIERLDTKTKLGATDYPTALYNVTWDQIRSENIGKVVPLRFEVCSNEDGDYCSDHTVEVTITGNTHLAPKMNRREWAIAKVGAVRVGETLNVDLPIVDGEDPSNAVSVSVLPEEMALFVKWEDGVLSVTPAKEGIGQFTLVAKSVYEQTVTEGFLFEALPSAWDSLVIVSGYGPNPESLGIKSMLGRGEVLSGAYQMTPNMLRLRDTMIVTTDALTNPDVLKNLEIAPKYVKTIIVSSPAIGNSKAIVKALDSLGIQLGAKVNDDLSRYMLFVDANSGLEAPKAPGGLKGTASSVSAHPQTFTGNFGSNGCKPLFNLQKPATSLVVGTECLNEQGRFIALGFELSDLLLSADDQDIAKKWLEQWTQN